jgi:hypothetical protein
LRKELPPFLCVRQVNTGWALARRQTVEGRTQKRCCMNSVDPDSTRAQAQRRRISRLGGLSKSSMYDAVEATSKARSAFLASFEKRVDPDHKLDDRERARRAEALMRAHMTRLSHLSAKKRRGGAVR